jgi:hypothetical protein
MATTSLHKNFSPQNEYEQKMFESVMQDESHALKVALQSNVEQRLADRAKAKALFSKK